MDDLLVSEFDAYFEAVHDHPPYPWQSRLTRRVLAEGRWPRVIDLPTGTGKTSVLDTAVFTLAARPDLFPRRVVFVIDRRIVVDQVVERARKIRDAVRDANGGVLAMARERLRALSQADEVLGVAALRGGIPIDGDWVSRPEQPWVLVSTVDQFGSRLLFRGYGVSERMGPVHAGLAGNDCLVILDEVHLSYPFACTLSDVSSDGKIPGIRSIGGGLPRRFEVVEMSATPTTDSEERFRLEPDDLESSGRLKQILEAPKRATLVEVPGTRPADETVPSKVLSLLGAGCRNLRPDERSVGVIVNRVRTAREVHAALRDKGIAAHLVIGRMRPLDKVAVMQEISDCVDPERGKAIAEPTVVVATQAIEVGADFSFDVLITEAAPIDSLQQRLGRLDRRGSLAAQRRKGNPTGGAESEESSHEVAARCWILGVASALNPKKLDPVYGRRARIAWEGLQQAAEGGEIDVGLAAGLLARIGGEAQADKSEAPLLLPTHIDAWSQTSPRPVIDPSIAEFLHGKESQVEPEVSVVWRHDHSERAISLVPPRPAEFLAVPISAAKDWLRGAEESVVSDVAIENPTENSGRSRTQERELTGVVRWTRRDPGVERLLRAEQVEPGDVLIVEPRLGGIRNGAWDPGYRPAQRVDPGEVTNEPGAAFDLGDEAQLEYGRRATLRLDERLFEGFVCPSPPKPAQERDAERSPNKVIQDWLVEVSESSPSSGIPVWMSEVVEKFVGAAPEIEIVNGEGTANYYVLVQDSVDPAALDGFDDKPSLTGTKTTLREHLVGVGAKVEEFAQNLGLPNEMVGDLRLAAQLHDLGKVDPRFQAQMHGHDSVRLASMDEPLAKSLPGAWTRRHEWPPVRHEFSSVALVQSVPELLVQAHDPDLVLHLVGSHHGYSRPLPAIKEDPESQTLAISGEFVDGRFRVTPDNGLREQREADGTFELSTRSDLAETPLALEMADRFWRLQAKYGHHGLAWLEAILRLADQQRSAEETAND
ncbi:MAG: type I-U CRISPR-associated helicase/endonuclease Cas3 [Acidimicrobiaceae bacterium]|nr:type I-U CRISPR-associated helicase/endonuclease Cas3 [Acidimicrobiaceae bacterium]